MPGDYREFFALALIHFLALISPGPDFAVIVRQSVRFGRQAGIATALGIGMGISVHVIYTLFGISALLHRASWLMNLAEMLGGGYLLYLGYGFIKKAGKSIPSGTIDINDSEQIRSFRRSFTLGFMTNATNPKATLFFLAVFTTVVSGATPLQIQILYVVWMCFVSIGWFVIVSLIFTNQAVRQGFLKFGGWFERLMGIVLIAFSLRLLWEVVTRLGS